MSEAFTTAQAQEHGCGRAALRGRSVRRELRGVYVPAGAGRSLLTRVDAARRVLPSDARPDDVTALHLLGIEVGGEEPLGFVTAHPHQVRRPRLRVRRSTAEVVETAGRPAPAFVPAARELDLVDLVDSGDRLCG